MEKEDKELKPKTPEQVLEECMEFLEEAEHKFVCFVGHFRTYLKKMGFREEK
ncbi:MAG: hypothetical protein ACOC1P_01850 [Minisyncoccales bacterium]